MVSTINNMNNDPDHVEVTEEEAEEIVSPENTEKLYGKKADRGQEEPPASNPDNVPTELPEDTDNVAEDNLFSETEE